MKRIALVVIYCMRFAWQKLQGSDEAAYTILFDAVQTLGGVFVKLLQFLSLRAEIFPDQTKLKFLTFYDQVPIEAMDVSAILTSELGSEALTRLRSIETSPFASGTFGQVYKAVLTDGNIVVIKIQRPNLRKKLSVDFFLIGIMGKVFDALYYQTFVDIPKLIREFKEITYKELDYQAEVENALYLHKEYRAHPVLTIPFTYRELSTDRIIVQEYIGGVAITDLLRMKAGGTDVRNFLLTEYKSDLHYLIKRFSYDSMWQIFTLDRFYSDPHPGNIKILPNNRYAFIDFGIIGTAPSNKRDYYNVIKYLSAGANALDANLLGEQLLTIGAHRFYKCMNIYDRIFGTPDSSLRQAVLGRYRELIDAWREDYRRLEAGKRENYTKVWYELFTMGERFTMQLPKGLFAGLRASALITSFTIYLAPESQVMTSVYRDIIRDIDEEQLVNVEDIKDKKIGVEDAIETIARWFEGVAETDLGLYHDLARLTA